MTMMRDPLDPRACPRLRYKRWSGTLLEGGGKDARDGTSVDVELAGVESENLLVRLGDGAEGLVELKLGDVLDREAGLLEGGGDGE